MFTFAPSRQLRKRTDGTARRTRLPLTVSYTPTATAEHRPARQQEPKSKRGRMGRGLRVLSVGLTVPGRGQAPRSARYTEASAVEYDMKNCSISYMLCSLGLLCVGGA
jgi:hypothetical protein